MYKDLNDYELLYLISEKDENAYNEICSKYSELVKKETNKIYRKCKYLGISKEDVYQAGLYALTKAIDSFDEHGGVLFYTYASTFVAREIQTFIRDKSRNKHNLLSDGISLDKEIDDEGTTLSSFILGNDGANKNYDDYLIGKWLLDLRYDMPDLCSQVFELRLNNFCNKEISVLLDTKYKTIDNSIVKIKNILKKELNKFELF
ncbi:MAG: sigma-70 family RNA polymerase sigma factor [Bacilli bacterium]|nr:sigma-70 family RNA polymerase sigma factor [Bacilli bacterium]